MLSHELLSHEKVFRLIGEIDRDRHLLFYSYLTQRKEKAQFFGQFNDGQLVAVMAYLSELSFPAFSFYYIDEQDIFFPELVAFTRDAIQLERDAVCGTILSPRDLHLFRSYSLITGSPNRFFTMKHEDNSKLLSSDMAELVKEEEFPQILNLLHSEGMRFFAKSEIEKCPFLGIKNGGEFIAVGGFHFYNSQLVELGNIVTRTDHRGKGLAKLLTSQLTYLGKKLSSDIYLGVLADNLPAVHIYEGLGYQTVAEQAIINFHLYPA